MFETTRPSFDSWYVTLPSRPLPSLLKLCHWGKKWGHHKGHIGLYKINFFSEYGHEVYQIKGNKTFNNMLANRLLLHLPLTPGVGSKD